MLNLILGTAQFGMNYGITNELGKVPSYEIDKILRYAREKGVKYLDSAEGYGDALSELGKSPCIDDFKIINKITVPIGLSVNELKRLFNDCLVRASMSLKADSVHSLIVHNGQDLDRKYFKAVVLPALMAIREEGVVKEVGMSVYSSVNTRELIAGGELDVVQFPMNIFNQDFYASDEIYRLSDLGIKLHIRSIFLQGVTLCDVIPGNIIAGHEEMAIYKKIQNETALSKMHISLNFFKELDVPISLVFGVTNLHQLKEVVQAVEAPVFSGVNYADLASNNESFINPVRWS